MTARSTSACSPALGWKVWFSTLLLGLALVACGGGSDGDAPDQQRPQANAISATLYAGEISTDFAVAELRVHGVQGLFRVAQRQPGGIYVTSLQELTGPYAVGVRYVNNNTGADGYLGSLTTGPGALNVTSLSTFAAAQLLGRDPTVAFGNLSATTNPSLSLVNEASLAQAQARVRTYLQRNFGFTVPTTVGDFFTTPFVARTGDPMYDTLVALNTLLTARGTNVFQVAAQMGNEAQICNAERITITAGGTGRDFCPASKNTQADSVDATITNFRFTDSAGATLTVQGRGSDVLTATLQEASGGASYSCSGAGCNGLSLGTPAGDQTRPVVFSNVALTGAAGTAVLAGTLQAAAPGAFYPPLSCDNRYYIAHADNRVDAACAAPDNTIGAGFGDTSLLGTIRRGYTFQSDGSVTPLAPALEVRADGQQVAGIFVRDVDPDTGTTRGLYKCEASSCNGVTIGPARDDVDSFAPFVLRNRLITIDDATLTARNPDGTPSGGSPVTVRATLDSFEIIFPDGFFPPADACRSPSLRLVAAVSDEALAIDVCPPDQAISDGAGFPYDPFLNTRLDGSGNLTYFIGTSYGSAGSDDGGVRINTDGAGIVDITFSQHFGSTYRCQAAGCAGVSISPPDGTGARVINFSGVVLQEVETAGLPGTRITTIDGSFTAPPLSP